MRFARSTSRRVGARRRWWRRCRAPGAADLQGHEPVAVAAASGGELGRCGLVHARKDVARVAYVRDREQFEERLGSRFAWAATAAVVRRDVDSALAKIDGLLVTPRTPSSTRPASVPSSSPVAPCCRSTGSGRIARRGW